MPGPTPTDPLVRFQAKVDHAGPTPPHRPELGPCAVWTSAVDQDGYPIFQLRSGTVRGVRWINEQHHGPLALGEVVAHHCDNPPCVRDEHHFRTSTLGNNQDRATKGRSCRGSAHPRHRWGPDAVVDVLRLKGSGQSFRQIARALSMPLGTVKTIYYGAVASA